MLSQDERRRLHQIERRLRRNDPAFAARMDSGDPADATPTDVHRSAFAGRVDPQSGLAAPAPRRRREPCTSRPPLLCAAIWVLVPALAATGRWPGALAVTLLATALTVAPLLLHLLTTAPPTGARDRG